MLSTPSTKFADDGKWILEGISAALENKPAAKAA